MYFKLFTLGSSLENNSKRYGFKVYSCNTVKYYNGENFEHSVFSPNKYLLDGDIWEVVESDLYEHLVCLAKTPLLTCDNLWKLFLLTKDEEDRIGALIIMEKKYYSLLLQKYRMTKDDECLKNNKKANQLLQELF